MFGALSTVKLIGLAIAAAAILSFVTLAFHWKNTMTARGQELEVICKATRVAADRPKLDCKLVTQQISLFGQNIATLKDGIARQNQKISAYEVENKRQQQELDAANKAAAKRVVNVVSVSKRLDASSKEPERQTKPCEPSKALQNIWH
jgi:sensor histidine kinase YesM